MRATDLQVLSPTWDAPPIRRVQPTPREPLIVGENKIDSGELSGRAISIVSIIFRRVSCNPFEIPYFQKKLPSLGVRPFDSRRCRFRPLGSINR